MRTLVATALVAMSLPALVVPAPAFADTTLGGYTATAASSAVRIQVYDPAIPIPADPQVDATLGFARSSTSTGPTARALASYVWPGDTLGDGLGVLAGNDAFDYPVKVNSRFPATESAPAKNTAQITDGNGMTTSADGTTTTSTVNLAELGTNLAGGTGSGLCALTKQQCPASAAPALPIPDALAAVATMHGGRSRSTVVLNGGTVSTDARSKVSGLSVLGGMITVDGVDMNATAVSDGARAKVGGFAKISGLRVAGQAVDLGDPVDLGGTRTALPVKQVAVAPLGVTVDYLKQSGSTDAATGSLGVEGLTITVDLAVLSKLAHTDAVTGPLAPVVEQIDQLGPLLNGLLKLGTKLVITVGDARASATASPAYVPPPLGPTGSVPTAPGSTSGSTAVVPPGGDALLPSEVPPAAVVPEGATPTTTGVQPASFQFPGLSRTPSLLLLGALLLIGLFGWLFRGLGAFFLGAGNCLLGATVGVPNLREG